MSCRFLIRWGAWLVASYLSCLPVQLISAAVHISFDSHQVEHPQHLLMLALHVFWCCLMTTFRRWLRRVCSWGGTLTEMVKLLQGWSQKQRLGRKERHKYEVVFNPGLMPSLQDLAFYVTEMPAEQLKRKVTLLLIIRAILAKFFTAESRASLAFLEDSKRVQQFNSSSILPLRLSRLHQKVLQIQPIVICKSLPRFDDYSFYYDEYLDMEECWEESDQVPKNIKCWNSSEMLKQ